MIGKVTQLVSIKNLKISFLGSQSFSISFCLFCKYIIVLYRLQSCFYISDLSFIKAGYPDIHMPLNEIMYLILHTKISSKWIKNLSVRLKTIKLLDDNIWKILLDLALGSEFFLGGYDTKSRGDKSKNRHMGLKQHPMECKKIFANHIYLDQGLISKICMVLLWLSSKNTNLIKTWATDMNRHFSSEDYK